MGSIADHRKLAILRDIIFHLTSLQRVIGNLYF